MGSIPCGISGSRAASIIGLSQYSTPFTVWQDIMEKRKPGFNAERGYIYEPFSGNSATEFGLAFEDAVCELTEQATGHNITDRERVYSLAEHVTCHIDGMINGKLYEGKTVNHRAFGFSWGEPGTDRIPVQYQVQVQHNMMCCGLTEAIMSAMVFPKTVDEWVDAGWIVEKGMISYYLSNPDMGALASPDEWAKVFAQAGFFHQYHIEAKPDTQKILKELYEEFWGKYVVPCVAPESVDFEDIRRCFSAPKGVLVVDEKQAELMREFRDVGKEIGKAGFLSKRRDFLKVQILKYAKDQTTVMDDEGQEKIVFRDSSGNKLGQFDGKTFRS